MARRLTSAIAAMLLTLAACKPAVRGGETVIQAAQKSGAARRAEQATARQPHSVEAGHDIGSEIGHGVHVAHGAIHMWTDRESQPADRPVASAKPAWPTAAPPSPTGQPPLRP
jgi:hypothetical protein